MNPCIGITAGLYKSSRSDTTCTPPACCPSHLKKLEALTLFSFPQILPELLNVLSIFCVVGWKSSTNPRHCQRRGIKIKHWLTCKNSSGIENGRGLLHFVNLQRTSLWKGREGAGDDQDKEYLLNQEILQVTEWLREERWVCQRYFSGSPSIWQGSFPWELFTIQTIPKS